MAMTKQIFTDIFSQWLLTSFDWKEFIGNQPTMIDS